MRKFRVASVFSLATLLLLFLVSPNQGQTLPINKLILIFQAVIQAEETTAQLETTTAEAKEEAATEASDPADANNEEIAEAAVTEKLESKEETEATPIAVESPPPLTTNVDKGVILRKPSPPLKDSANAFRGKKRCRCIEKKHRQVLKQITYVPLEPILLGEGQHKRFNCNCQQMRRMEIRRARPTYIVQEGPPRQSWG